MSTSAPPELPGLIAALVWIMDGNVTLLSSCTASRNALTIPSVKLDLAQRLLEALVPPGDEAVE